LKLVVHSRLDTKEVNAGGVYGWLEYHTGVPITAALVDLLAGGAR
jgi:hypothetical protein